MRRAVLYLRTSTGEQDPDNQRPDLEQLARMRRLTIIATYEEQASAAKARPVFDRLIRDAHRGAFDVVLVWSLDRFGRSMVGNVNAVLELDRKGVHVVSVREPWLETEGPVRQLLIAILSWVAEQEREQLIARTKAGLARAKRNGKRLGRPRTHVDVDLARRLHAEGKTWRQVARFLRVSHVTLHRLCSKNVGTHVSG